MFQFLLDTFQKMKVGREQMNENNQFAGILIDIFSDMF